MLPIREAVVIGPQMTDLRVEQMQVMAQRFFPMRQFFVEKDFPGAPWRQLISST